jgi:mannose-1-phosphate guanylyltransferase
MYYAVIMAGGSGTRLWPLSRQKHPKQALKLVGEKTMFQYAVDRITPLFPLDSILVVTRAEHGAILMDQVPNLPKENFILEPEGRGTAPAIGLSATHLAHRDPQAVMCILTADHFIAKPQIFRKALASAEKTASDGSLVTLGIQPSSASTGFGYIQQGEFLGEIEGFKVHRVIQFTEKPDPTTAERMVDSGNYSWNSGMFIWKVDRILKEFQQQMPGFFEKLSEIKEVLDSLTYPQILDQIWPTVEKQTIDYGIMENAEDVIVIPVEIGWNDIGSWGSLFDLSPLDEDGNLVVGNPLNIDTKRTLIYGEKRLIATLGVEDLIIIDTEDALLVCSRDREQDVKAIVDQLKNGKMTGLI